MTRRTTARTNLALAPVLILALVLAACSNVEPDTAVPAEDVESPTTIDSTLAERTETTDGEPTETTDGGDGSSLSAGSAFERGDCLMDLPFGLPPGVGLTCGFVTAPIDHGVPDGPTIRLATVFVDNGDGGTPVVFLPGGPGGSAYSIAPSFAGAPFDVIAFDERGVGFSEPSLNCEEADDLFLDIVTMPVRATLDRYGAALEACRARLTEAGVDFALFDSAQSARDIGAVHRALGFDEVFLLGASYGTRLALTKARDEPEGIEGMILDSVVPLDVNMLETRTANFGRAFDMLADQCASDPDCAAMGDVAANVDLLAEKLTNEPLIVTAERPYGRGSVDVLVDGDRLHLLVLGALYRAEMFEQLPRAVFNTLEGEPNALRPLVEDSLFALDPEQNTSEGFSLSVICREEFPFNDVAELQAGTTSAPPIVSDAFDTVRDCAIWDTTPAADVENEPVTSSIPTLVFAGAFDPVTPPGDSRLVASRLPNATYVEIPGGGHGVAPTTACGRSIVEAFIVQPGVSPDVSCVDGLPGPDWQS